MLTLWIRLVFCMLIIPLHTSIINQNQSTPLHLAAQNGHISLAENLIKCGAIVNATEAVSYFACMCTCNLQTVFLQDQWTSLHLAALNGHTSLVEILIKCGAKVNAVEVVSYYVCMYLQSCKAVFCVGSMDTITFSCTKWS